MQQTVTKSDEPLADRDWILADLHLHTSWSHDCTVEVDELLDNAEAQGLGAIAVTDHNVFGGALEAVELARGRDLIVIPGEEVKTDGQGEVIGLFLSEEIPRGMSFADTVAAIKEQGGLVYLPHPFDRLHSIPDAATLRRNLADIDVFEVYNARLLFEGYNDEALRFARKYNLTMGAGSDAHVPQGLATGRRPHARLRRPRGVPPQPPQRRDPPPAEVARVPAVPEMGGPGQGKSPLDENWKRARRDTCVHRRDLREVPQEGDRRDQRARPRDRRAPARASVCLSWGPGTRAPTSSC